MGFGVDKIKQWRIPRLSVAQRGHAGVATINNGQVCGTDGAPIYSASLRNISNTQYPAAQSGSFKQSMSRMPCRNHVATSSFNLVYQGNMSGGPIYGDSQISVGVEYPAGTVTPVKFSGAQVATLASGSELISDAININIPRRAKYWIRTWFSNPNQIVWAMCSSADYGFEFGATVSDKSLGGNIGQSGLAYFFGPVAVIAISDVPSVLLLGDSRVAGIADSRSNSMGLIDGGILARSIGAAFPYINCGAGGDSSSGIIGGGINGFRPAIGRRFCTSAIFAYGINDFKASATGSSVFSNAKTIRDYFAMPFSVATVAPESSSTDSWGTTQNQSPTSINAQRIIYNDMVRQSQDFYGAIELSDIVETSRNSSVWKVGFTSDGLHENAAACVAIANQSMIRQFVV